VTWDSPKGRSFGKQGINEEYNKASLRIWEFHNKITSYYVSLKDKDKDCKFVFCYMKLGTNDYVKKKFVQEIF
jgi:hypothetical protein